jgi:hypothetical protein
MCIVGQPPPLVVCPNAAEINPKRHAAVIKTKPTFKVLFITPP